MKNRIDRLLRGMNAGLYGKEECSALVLLASLSGEGVFMLGPPGVAKSLVARRLSFVWKDASVFEYLMSRFSTPDEIFGPVSISRLKNEDVYKRAIEGYLPSADIVFLDEIWKAGPAIQNTLLTVLNEKRFRNGTEELTLPLKALLAASNGAPSAEDGLDALWDRFLVRVKVGGVEEDELFLEMLSSKDDSLSDTIAEKDKITVEEYLEWERGIQDVEFGERMLAALLRIKKSLPSDWYVSDRRWRKIVRLLRASAFFNGRSAASLTDLLLVRHCIWRIDGEGEIHTAQSAALDAALYYITGGEAGIQEIEGVKSGLAALFEEIRRATVSVEDGRKRELELVNARYYTARRADKLCYIRNDQYALLSGSQSLVTLYKKQKLARGYIRHNASAAASRESAFTLALNDSNIDLEAHFTEERTASASRTNEEAALTIDGERWTLDTAVRGECRKVRRKAEERLALEWDRRISDYNSWITGAKSAYAEFEKREAGGKNRNLFVSGADMEKLCESVAHIKAELDSLLLQTGEIAHSYRNITEGFEIIDAPPPV